MNLAVLLLGGILVFIAYALATRRRQVETFEWTAPKGTYTFGSPTPKGASDLDKSLGKLVDSYIPKDVVDGGGQPVPEPYADSEAEEIAKGMLARVKDRTLDFVNVEYVGKSADKNGNVYYDIAFLAYDKGRAMMAKLALTTLVARTGRKYVRRFSSFDRPPSSAGVEGTTDFSGGLAPYEEELGIDYARLYVV